MNAHELNWQTGDLLIADITRPHKGIEYAGVYTLQRIATHGNSVEVGEEWHPTEAFDLYRKADWRGVNGVAPQASDKGRRFRFVSTHRADKAGEIFTLVSPPVKWATGFGEYARSFDCAWVSNEGELFTFAHDDRIQLV